MSIQSCEVRLTTGLRNLGSEVRIFLAAQPRENTTEYERSATEFVAKIDRSGGPGACWPWIGEGEQGGDARKTVWKAVYGVAGCELGDSCGNAACCNPDHLERPAAHSWRHSARAV